MANPAARLIATGAVLAATAASAAPGAGLADPTRPPVFAAAASAPLRAASAPRAAASQPVVVQVRHQLQALFLPRGGVASALVDNQLVRSGDKLGERIIVTIDAQGLVTRSATGTATERLWLLGASPKLPPGSITLSRSTTFSPVPQAGADPAPAALASTAATALPALAAADKGKP